MNKGKIQDFSIYSKELDEHLEILVYLPPQYTPLFKYSYCIAQDGKDYFQLGRIPRTIDLLINEGEIVPILFFGIPYKNVADRREKYHPTGKKKDAYLRFLVNELLPYIEREYSVLQLAKARALAGDSLAGTISLIAGIEYPNTFGNLMLHSPYVDKRVLEAVKRAKNLHTLSIYHVVGKQETSVKLSDGSTADFLAANRELSSLLKEMKLDYFYEEYDGDHTWKYWQKDLERALVHLFSE